MSDYRKRLLEKQKLRFSYWLPERQFRRYVSRAFQQRGITGENLIRLLERRLDTLVYRLGFASNILAARQLVLHGHILVNGQSTDRPNYLARAGDEISVKERSRGIVPVRQGMELSLARPDIPYLAKDRKGFCGKLASIPMREEVPLSVNEGLVVEYYAKYI
jgi:small subunit ribosomal protein S4